VRRFYLQRDEDPSGVSGTGRVAEGVEFDSGWVALHFDPRLKGVKTIYPYRDIADMYLLHGHGGKTQIVWIDP
jgi:hypothetical protein